MNKAVGAPRPIFDHLARLTDARGLAECALDRAADPGPGYCVDDAARALVVICREPDPSPELQRLGYVYLDFVLGALQADGTFHNRMAAGGYWRDAAGVDDCWGRGTWGLGVAAARGPSEEMRIRALAGFRVAATQLSPHSRAMAFAALGAGELLAGQPDEHAARALLRAGADRILGRADQGRRVTWRWPEPRLTYSNGCLVEVLLLAGDLLADAALVHRGLDMLSFLVHTETRAGHVSVTPVDGRGPRDTGPGFDQKPSEVAALADACARAYAITSDPRWLITVRQAWRWFLGDNDSGSSMFDPVTGAAYDRLGAAGHSADQGAESTLAMLSTAQHARQVTSLR